MNTLKLCISCIGKDIYKYSRFYDVVYKNGYYITIDSYNRKYLADNIGDIYKYIIDELDLKNIEVIHLKEIGDKNSIINDNIYDNTIDNTLVEFKNNIYECLSNKLSILKEMSLEIQ